MRHTHCFSAPLVSMLLVAIPTADAQQGGLAQVQIPLETYERLQASASSPDAKPGYALGGARATIDVTGAEPRATASVVVDLDVEVRENRWVAVPIVPAVTAVESATVGGKPVPLVFTEDGLAWSTGQAGSHTVKVAYRVDATRSDSGWSIAVPLPRTARVQLAAKLPGVDLDVAVIPAVNVKTAAAGSTTEVSAIVPAGGGVQIAWRTASRQRYSLSRAEYRGELAGDAVVWKGEIGLEIFGEGATLVPLFPRSVTLTNLTVDGASAPILAEGKRLATLVRGRGEHRILLGFETPVVRQDGPPRIDLDVPQVPVSRFDLTLPGNKSVSVTPSAHVSSRSSNGSTLATVYVPVTERVALAWSEAIPDEEAELRTSAATYHLVHAEEGILHVRAFVDLEVSRGESSVIELTVPAGVQIERIGDASGVIADWRMTRPAESGRDTIGVFLDRALRGSFRFEVEYDRPLPDPSDANGIEVPLIQVEGANRRRGMVALLSGAELALLPIEESGATKVGENQLPELVREAVKETIAHTYKYAETLPTLLVRAAPPVKEVGKFDAQVDTLVSLGDATLTCAASIEVRVKSGSLDRLELEIPQAVNVLGLTAPSIRSYEVTPRGESRLVAVDFTQEMEGTFRVDVSYERILEGAGTDLEVPTLSVGAAEVEQGRIAVEALSAIEVRPDVAENLSPLDVSELPRQLLLRTTNPILLAYKYVQASPVHRLKVDLARHRVLDVQEAAIDRAEYRTLVTPDGLSVTTARFLVRNSRKQFLRVRLPKESVTWSVFVNGLPEKPALAESATGEGSSVLVKIVNSTDGFPVELVYATTGPELGKRGTVRAALPRPDILVTESRWDVYLPEEMSYGVPTTNMSLAETSDTAPASTVFAPLAKASEAAATGQGNKPLRIVVPTSGFRLSLEKLYANQSDQDAWFSVSYRHP